MVVSVYADLTISFQELSYNITEGLTVRVCADIISGISATSVIIDVSTAEGTAEGEGLFIYYLFFYTLKLK